MQLIRILAALLGWRLEIVPARALPLALDQALLEPVAQIVLICPESEPYAGTLDRVRSVQADRAEHGRTSPDIDQPVDPIQIHDQRLMPVGEADLSEDQADVITQIE